MNQPSGCVVQGKERKVYKLQRAIYDLKQSPRAWFDKFSGTIGKYDFTQCYSDHFVFAYCQDSSIVILVIY